MRMELLDYNLKIVYVPGRQQSISETLSRNPKDGNIWPFIDRATEWCLPHNKVGCNFAVCFNTVNSEDPNLNRFLQLPASVRITKKIQNCWTWVQERWDEKECWQITSCLSVWTLYRHWVPGAGTRYLVPLVCILDSYLDLYPTFAYISTNVTIFSVRPIYVSQLKTLIYKIALQMTSNKTNETQIM